MSTHTLSIHRLSQLGEGVATWESRAVFVPGTFPGDVMDAELSEEGRVLRGRMVRLLTASPDRREGFEALDPCCGGHPWEPLSDLAQQQAKLEVVLGALEHLGGIRREQLDVQPVLTGPPTAYRRRAVLHFTREGLGLFEHGTHQRVTVARCPMLTVPLQELPGKLAPLLRPLAKDAEEVHLLAEGDRVSFAVMLKGKLKARHPEVADAAVRALKLEGAVLVPKGGSPLEVRKPVLRALLPLTPEVPLFLRPDAFAQANQALNVGLVAAALTQLAPTPSDRVLELYSGNGNFTFALAGVAREVLAIEGAAVSMELARRSAREGGIGNVRFMLSPVAPAVKGLVAEGAPFELLLADPPRSGAPGIGRWARQLNVRRVVYVACDPGALARDGKELLTEGYVPRVLQVVDMFPQTRHVESVLSFERVG